MGTELALQTDNLIAPIRADMVDMTGSEDAAKRITHAFTIAVRQTPKLLLCDPVSIQSEILKCCSDGLVPDSKEAVILPYNEYDKETNQSTLKANYQPMVYGVIKRMKELGSVTSITVELVHEKDQFHANLSDPEDTKHEFDMFSSERGKIVGAYCIARDKDRKVIHREIMSREDLNKVRKASQSPNSPAWQIWESEMFKKAVLRRLSKYISLDNDKIRQLVQRMDDLYANYSQRSEPERGNPFAPKQLESSAAASLGSGAGEGQTTKPSSNQSSAGISSDPSHNAGDGAPDGSGTSPSGADAKPKEKPELTLDEIQAFCDHLWGSQRSKQDIKADSQQYKAKHWQGKGSKKNGQSLITEVLDIHEARVSGKDKVKADKFAADKLAELGFEIPNGVLEDA